VWKIADFGLTAIGNTIRQNTTNAARGKPCYRAPELLREQNSSYSKQVDIWSLGCVLHELCIGKKAFSSDWAAFEYAALGGKMKLQFPDWFDDKSSRTLGTLILDMLHVDYSKRPTTLSIRNRLSDFRRNLDSGVDICMSDLSLY
jgi:serine/threonine protein kinase